MPSAAAFDLNLVVNSFWVFVAVVSTLTRINGHHDGTRRHEVAFVLYVDVDMRLRCGRDSQPDLDVFPLNVVVVHQPLVRIRVEEAGNAADNESNPSTDQSTREAE